MNKCRIDQEVMDQEERHLGGSDLVGQKHRGREARREVQGDAWGDAQGDGCRVVRGVMARESMYTEGVESRSMKGHP